MKFGKQIQKRQLEVPEYAASFVNYKALKKLIKKLSASPAIAAKNGSDHSQAAPQGNKATFFFQLERELDKVNAFYLQKEAELKIRLKTLLDKKKVLQARHDISGHSYKFTTLEEGFQQFAADLNKLQQFVEINGTAFSKILKKWDKSSKSRTKELYLSRAVEVQPFFNAPVISELSDQATTSLQELGAWADGIRDSIQPTAHVAAAAVDKRPDIGDTDTILLDTAISGNLDSLREFLLKMKVASDARSGHRSFRERITRTFLSAIHSAPRDSLQLLLESGQVDLHSFDDINERNCLHQAAIYGKQYVLEWGLGAGVAVSRTDIYGRVPLHYAGLHGRLDMLNALLAADPQTVDLIDHDNFTPLIHAIMHDKLDCVGFLLSRGARIDPASETDLVPLNIACEHGSESAMDLILKHGARIVPDAEGLYPQHMVARAGKSSRQLLLLKQYGADLNQVDRLYGWTPLFHAASEGNIDCLKALLKVGVDAKIVDEKGLPAIYYAAWEGHLECMQLLALLDKRQRTSVRETSDLLPKQMGELVGPGSMALDPDAIPVLELPPPIIPLRRYGHNFLDTKAMVEISFEDSKEQPLVFFHDGKYPAARLAISSKVSGFIPKNILLPFQEDTRVLALQVDKPDTFSLDFDVFPMYGAKVIAKSVALPSAFRAGKQGKPGCSLPLFDPRLRAIGQISFSTQVIKPFRGRPLEMADFETYWKATSQSNQPTSAVVTGSNLSGDYVRLDVQFTGDGVPVVWSRSTVACGPLQLPICRLSLQQLAKTTAASEGRVRLPTLASKTAKDVGEIYEILASSGATLQETLSMLPLGIHVNLHILFPSPEDEKAMEVNALTDAILTAVFNHARAQRRQLRSPDVARSMVFSSYSRRICTALNWKQPNFPVFLCNDLAKGDAAGGTAAQARERRSMSIKEMVRIAQRNNFLGLICSWQLLDMVPTLVEAIKSHGLALVMDTTSMEAEAADEGDGENGARDRQPGKKERVDGVLKRPGILRFTDSIDI